MKIRSLRKLMDGVEELANVIECILGDDMAFSRRLTEIAKDKNLCRRFRIALRQADDAKDDLDEAML